MHDADSKTGDSAPSVSLRSPGPTLSRPWPGKRWRAAAEQESSEDHSDLDLLQVQQGSRPSPTTTSHETAPPGPYAQPLYSSSASSFPDAERA
ncbi:hypothetical protein AcW2_000289 [Taiwanofungus camphoratus]|nr:hypothetical protein AcW2_000289 [Antrodia cinnamomea]